jgi:hypothetical protein
MTANREPDLGSIAHSLTQCTIARHGLRAAVQILHDAAELVDEVLREQQQRHPEDWPELKQDAVTPPAVPAQPAQTDLDFDSNMVKIPQIPRVTG